MDKKEHQESRRDFLKKAAYTAPVILTMSAAPAFARNGSPHICEQKPRNFSRSNYSKPQSFSRGSDRPNLFRQGSGRDNRFGDKGSRDGYRSRGSKGSHG